LLASLKRGKEFPLFLKKEIHHFLDGMLPKEPLVNRVARR